MAYDIQLTGKNNKEALHLLDKIGSIIQTNNLEYWLDGGTLLGITRENRLLPWDDDIDLSMFNPGEDLLSNLVKSIKKDGFRVRVKTFKSSDKYFEKGAARIIKIRTKKALGMIKGKVCLEIFIRKRIEDKTYCRIGKKTQVIPYEFCKSLKKIKFLDKEYFVPELTDKYLTYKYGDWKTPVKQWSVFSDDNSMI